MTSQLRQLELVVIGASLGGLSALETVLSGLSDSFPLPIAVVQHRHSLSSATMGQILQRSSTLPVADAYDGQPIQPGRVALAPPGSHLVVNRGLYRLSNDAPVHHSRPAIDRLFQSAVATYGAGVIGILLTGASQDGAMGLADIKARGGLAIVQDPTEAESQAMPRAALAATPVDHILQLSEIPPLLHYLAQRSLISAS